MINLLTSLFNLLNGDATLLALATSGVWQGAVAPKTAPPFVIFYQVPGAGPEHVFGGAEAFDEILIGAKGVAVNADVAEQIRERLQTLLANAALSVTGFEVLSFLRAQPLVFSEEVGGVTRFHRGDFFRTQLQKV